MTNSHHISLELRPHCDGGHEHQALVGGTRAKEAQVYPVELCRAICRGLIKEKRARKGGMMPLMKFSTSKSMRHKELAADQDHVEVGADFFGEGSSLSPSRRFAALVEKECKLICFLQKQGQGWVAYDDNTGLELNADNVYEARMKEVQFVDGKKVWTMIPRAEAKRRGWRVLKARWIDIKGIMRILS